MAAASQVCRPPEGSHLVHRVPEAGAASTSYDSGPRLPHKRRHKDEEADTLQVYTSLKRSRRTQRLTGFGILSKCLLTGIWDQSQGF